MEDILLNKLKEAYSNIKNPIHSVEDFKDYEISFQEACNYGYLKIVQWMYSINNDIIDNCHISLACCNGHIELVKWLCINYKDKKKDDFLHELLSLACYQNHISLAEWVYSINNDQNKLSRMKLEFYMECKRNNINQAKKIYSIEKDAYKYDDENDDNSVMHMVCKFGHLDMAKWLYSIDNNIIYICDDYNTTPFYVACENDKKHIAEWLYSIDSNVYKRDDEIFHMLCEKGNLKTADWLHSIDNSVIYSYDENGFTPFHRACTNTSSKAYEVREVLEWLHDIDGDLIDMVTKDGESSFCISLRYSKETAESVYNISMFLDEIVSIFSACCCDNKDDVQYIEWLYSMEEDILIARNENGNTGFYEACMHGNLKIAKWIYDNSDIYIAIDISKITNTSVVDWLKSIQTRSVIRFTNCPICKNEILDNLSFIKLYISSVENCPICLDTIKNPHSLNCGHVFCKCCLLT